MNLYAEDQKAAALDSIAGSLGLLGISAWHFTRGWLSLHGSKGEVQSFDHAIDAFTATRRARHGESG